jgi:hypothetical protein
VRNDMSWPRLPSASLAVAWSVQGMQPYIAMEAIVSGCKRHGMYRTTAIPLRRPVKKLPEKPLS